MCYSSLQVQYLPEKSFILFPVDQVEKLKASELLNLVYEKYKNHPSCIISICSKQGFCMNLDGDDIPGQICPDIFFVPKYDDYTKISTKFFLQVAEKKESYELTVSFNITVATNGNLFLYSAPMIMKSKDLSIRSIIRKLKKIHNCQTSSSFTAHLITGRKVTDVQLPFIKLCQEILYERIYIVFEISDELKKKLRKRVMAVTEFLTTEEKYNSQMNGFVENVGKVFEKAKFLDKFMYDNILNAAQLIAGLHVQLLEDIKAIHIDYMCCIGALFKKFAPFLKAYHDYVARYKAAMEQITKAMNTPQYSSIFLEFQNSSYAHGLTFDSILIIPVQRGPRYPLLLREILKATPKDHPDYEPLQQAYDITKDSLKKLEIDVSVFERHQKMMQLEKMFDSKVDLIQPTRLYINGFDIINRNDKFLLILFSDIVWFAQYHSNNSNKLKFLMQYEYSEIDLITYSKQSIIFRYNNIDKPYSLASPDVRNTLIAEFRETSICRQNIGRTQVPINWDIIEVSKHVYLYGHSMAFYGKALWIYGGINKEGETEGSIRQLYLAKNQMLLKQYNKATDPPPRSFASLVVYNDGLYLFGGKDGNDAPLNDFWLFDMNERKWKRIDAHGDLPPGGPGLNFTCVNKLLLLTGGDPFQIHTFSPEKNLWSGIITKRGIPPKSLFYHEVAPLDKGLVMIIGGKSSNGIFNNYLYMLTKNGESVKLVKTGGQPPMNRAGHRVCVVKNCVVVVGGEDEALPFVMYQNQKSWAVPVNESVKLPLLKHFGVAIVENNIWIHGGQNENGEIQAGVYKLTLDTRETDQLIVDDEPYPEDQFFTNTIKNPSSVKDIPWRD